MQVEGRRRSVSGASPFRRTFPNGSTNRSPVADPAPPPAPRPIRGSGRDPPCTRHSSRAHQHGGGHPAARFLPSIVFHRSPLRQSGCRLFFSPTVYAKARAKGPVPGSAGAAWQRPAHHTHAAGEASPPPPTPPPPSMCASAVCTCHLQAKKSESIKKTNANHWLRAGQLRFMPLGGEHGIPRISGARYKKYPCVSK